MTDLSADISPIAESVGDTNYRRIRSDILTGKLAPGKKLKLDSLRSEYGAGVSTLREILNRLVAEQLVIAEGQRGFEVMPISADNLKEIAALRHLLECQAIEESFRRGDIEWEARVIAAYHKLSQMEAQMKDSRDKSSDLWKRHDWEFHKALVSACHSRVLKQTHATVFERYLRYQMIALSYRGDIAAAEHKAMRDAALRRDAVAACEILSLHIDGGVAHALATGAIG